MYLTHHRRFQFLEVGDVVFYKEDHDLDIANNNLSLKYGDKLKVIKVERSSSHCNIILQTFSNIYTVNLYDYSLYENVKFTKQTKKNVYQRIIDNKIKLFMDVYRLEEELKIDDGNDNKFNTPYTSYAFRKVYLDSKNAKDLYGDPINGSVISIEKIQRVRTFKDAPNIPNKYLGTDYIAFDQVEEYICQKITMTNLHDWGLSENGFHQWNIEYIYFLNKKGN